MLFRSAHIRDTAGYEYEMSYGSKSREFKGKLNAKGITVYTQEVTAGGTVTPHVANGCWIVIRLNANTTISNISGLKAAGSLDTYGGEFDIVLIQDGTGGWGVTWGGNFNLRGATVNTAANSVTAFKFKHIDPNGGGNNSFVRLG